MKRFDVDLLTDRFHIRSIKLEDVSERWCQWTADPLAALLLNAPRQPLDIAQLRAHVESIDQIDRIMVGIFDRATGQHVGVIAADFIDDLPDGYETVIGEHGFSLSGGQRQRIAIARAVLADPRVLVLDDATSAVDPSKEHEIRAALREVMTGRTTIIIAHRPATIALADRVVLIDEGKVVAEGTHEELVATSDRYRDVLAHSGERAARARRP